MELASEILSEITVHMKYAKYLPEQQRRETWVELVTRNMNMHIKKYPDLEEQIRDKYQYVYKKKVLPSMRSMQFGGKPCEISPNRIYNCAYIPIDHIDSFSETMFLLLRWYRSWLLSSKTPCRKITSNSKTIPKKKKEIFNWRLNRRMG